MTQRIGTVLLVDDSEADNYFHRLMIEEANVANSIVIFQRAADALEALAAAGRGEQSMPDLVFLDINMPAIDGWEFLRRYEICVPSELRSPVIVILSTSLNPADRERALTFNSVSAYCSKPLSPQLVRDLVVQHIH